MASNGKMPPVPEGAAALAEAVMEAFDNTAQMYRMVPAEVMVGLGAATAMIIQHTAQTHRLDPQKMLDDYRTSLKLPPPPEKGK